MSFVKKVLDQLAKGIGDKRVKKCLIFICHKPEASKQKPEQKEKDWCSSVDRIDELYYLHESFGSFYKVGLKRGAYYASKSSLDVNFGDKLVYFYRESEENSIEMTSMTRKYEFEVPKIGTSKL